VTRDLGTTWLEKNENVLLRVSSVIVPETVNFLFNPSRKLATKFRITDVFPIHSEWLFLSVECPPQPP
jgi:hypothetical protein